MMKRPLAILLGITGDFSFAAGCLLQALHRHSPDLNADILVYTDGNLPETDQTLLCALGARLVPFSPLEANFQAEYLKTFSLLTLATLEGLCLLDRYKTVIWLDVDTAIQDDISDLVTYGPLGMALEDPHFSESGVTSPASINVTRATPGLAPDEPNLNADVVVFQDTLPDAKALYRQCREWICQYAEYIKYIDQPALNMLAQDLRRRDAALFSLIPHDRFNAHPRNPGAQYATIVHAFGAYKLWDDGLTRCAFPEWERDYRRWVAKGGSPWQGLVENSEFLDGGAFFVLTRLHGNMSAAQKALDAQQAELERERILRRRFEGIAQKFGGS
ncbi:MAG: glycosyltransferase [Desulfovibrio sp.]|jgi:lipopolysaccharide biosynthesis glycosyltransferase|nr:glycosyltransferase [Desulfovibrio sp.]